MAKYRPAIHGEFKEKLAAIAYHRGLSVEEVMEQALLSFATPEEIKQAKISTRESIS